MSKTPENTPEEEPQEAQNQSIQIEKIDLEEAKRLGDNIQRKLEDEKVRLIKNITINVMGELLAYLDAKNITELRRLSNMEPIDILLSYVDDETTQMANRARKLQSALSKIARITGTSSTPTVRGKEAIEQMLFERLAQSMAGSIGSAVEAQTEAQRRRRLSEEILKELTSNQQSSNEGEQK